MRTGITIKQPDGNLYQPEKENNAMANMHDTFHRTGKAETNPTPNPAIKVGDHVRSTISGNYLGTVTRIVSFYRVENSDGYNGDYDARGIELAPRLTPDEAWAELPYLVLNQVNSQRVYGAVRLHEYDMKQIRHECYKLLGGSGVKVTDEVKARVRKAIARVASELGVELA